MEPATSFKSFLLLLPVHGNHAFGSFHPLSSLGFLLLGLPSLLEILLCSNLHVSPSIHVSSSHQQYSRLIRFPPLSLPVIAWLPPSWLGLSFGNPPVFDSSRQLLRCSLPLLSLHSRIGTFHTRVSSPRTSKASNTSPCGIRSTGSTTPRTSRGT